MDIHKPKPARNLREFTIEILTIVAGVIIAISLEQFVEYLHWHHEVQIGRKALADEIAAIDTFYVRRILIAPCLDRQLDEDAARIRNIAAIRKVTPYAPAAFTPGALLSDAEWQSERSSQALTHFPREELALMSRFYAQTADMREWEFNEQHALSALNAMADDPDHLGPADLAQLRVSLNEERAIEYLIVLNSGRNLAVSTRLGVPYKLPDRETLKHWCRPGEKLGRLPS